MGLNITWLCIPWSYCILKIIRLMYVDQFPIFSVIWIMCNNLNIMMLCRLWNSTTQAKRCNSVEHSSWYIWSSISRSHLKCELINKHKQNYSWEYRNMTDRDSWGTSLMVSVAVLHLILWGRSLRGSFFCLSTNDRFQGPFFKLKQRKYILFKPQAPHT